MKAFGQQYRSSLEPGDQLRVIQLNQQNLRHIIPGLSLGLSRVSFFNDINPGTLYSISTHREALKQTAVENQLLIEFPEHNSASSINTLISEKSSR